MVYFVFGVTQDFEQLGRAFSETLLDYYDENPNKVNNLLKILKRRRRRERKLRKAARAAKKAAIEEERLKQNYETDD